jgi:hypothetical protein
MISVFFYIRFYNKCLDKTEEKEEHTEKVFL